MRQLNGFSSNLTATAATSATNATSATLSNMAPGRAAGGGAVAGGFGAAFRQVQDDVARFIRDGGGGFSAPEAAPSSLQAVKLQALAAQQRATGAGAIGGLDQGSDNELQQQFLASIKPWAEETAGKLGVSSEIVSAHAALESGWGRQPLRQGGVDTNNLFGLKAGASWRGAVAAATTTEYEQGAMLKKTERFRSYPDTASAFRDYADMLTSNPRYQGALNTGSDAHAFASALARGGYASDPAYADKLSKLATQLQQSARLNSGN